MAETGGTIYMVEAKARTDLGDAEVQATANAATKWCQHATGYAKTNGGMAWVYLMIPHDEINEARRLVDYERFVKK